MPYVALPAALAAKVRLVRPRLLSPAQKNTSAWTRTSKILLLPGSEEWSFSMAVLPLATERDIRVARAFFFALHGIANTFEVPFLPTPQAHGDWVITASGAAVAGAKQVSVSSAAGLVAGMPVSIAQPSGHKRLVIITAISGSTLTFQPGLTEDISSGAEIEVANPVCHVRLADPMFSYDDNEGIAGFAVEIEEANREAGSVARPLNTVDPAITGSAVVGGTLNLSNGTWSNAPTSFTYQWYADDVEIVGKTGNSLVVSSGYQGQSISARVTAHNASGYRIAESNTVGPIPVLQPPVNTVAPALSGTALNGEQLSVTNGTWTGEPTVTFARQWKRSGTPIPGATGSTYTLIDNDVGKTIYVTVTGTNSVGSASENSNVLGPVDDTEPPENTVRPAITGTATAGYLLTASTGTWTNSPTSYAYQWRRGGVAISGATSSTYELVAADEGENVTVTVTATNAFGSTAETSNSVGPIVGNDYADFLMASDFDNSQYWQVDTA